jgi:hypothetical protein
MTQTRRGGSNYLFCRFFSHITKSFERKNVYVNSK